MMIASFVVFLALFVLIGLSSSLRTRRTKADYYVASQSMPAWLVGLSAVATNNSGYMFIGVIGYTYATGLAAVWLMIGWITGDLLASFLVHPRLRKAAQNNGELSYAGVISQWHGAAQPTWQRLAGLVALLFLLAYTSAQLVAGSKALQVLFDWPVWAGATIGASMVAAYCFAGGIRASIWTDAAQSIVMIGAMGLLLVTATGNLGGIAAAISEMRAIDGFLDWQPEGLPLPGLGGIALFTLGWVFAGFSVVGQPHVMVRFMTLKAEHSMARMRWWYYLWFSAFYLMATLVGLLSRVYLPDTAGFDAELALPSMAEMLLPGVLVGLILAGIFAATMSTADSLVLSCSAAITHDLLPHRIERTSLLKATTLLITMLALAWALLNRQSVFSLVILSWSALAAVFVPILLTLVCGGRPSQAQMLGMSGAALLTLLIWRAAGWHAVMYEGMPATLAGLLVFWLWPARRLSPVQSTN